MYEIFIENKFWNLIFILYLLCNKSAINCSQQEQTWHTVYIFCSWNTGVIVNTSIQFNCIVIIHPRKEKFIRWIQNIAPHPLKTKLYTVHAIWMHNGHIWCQIVKIFPQYSRQIKIQHKAFMHNDVT